MNHVFDILGAIVLVVGISMAIFFWKAGLSRRPAKGWGEIVEDVHSVIGYEWTNRMNICLDYQEKFQGEAVSIAALYKAEVFEQLAERGLIECRKRAATFNRSMERQLEIMECRRRRC